MKRSVLLLTAGLMTVFANGQEAHKSVILLQNQEHLVNAGLVKPADGTTTPLDISRKVGGSSVSYTGARTTATPMRWYDYTGELLDAYETSSGKFVSYFSADMWNDTTGMWSYTSTSTPFNPYVTNGEANWNVTLSIAAGLDPTYSLWNVVTPTGPYGLDYTGAMGVGPTNAYNVDSVFIPGWYTRNPAKPTIVDTMIVAFVYGKGSTAASDDLPGASLTGSVLPDYCGTCTSLTYVDIYHDSLNNRAAHSTGAALATQVYKFPMTIADTNGLSGSNYRKTFPRSSTDPVINVAVPAGNSVAMTVTFKSGDAAFHHGGDTIRYSNGTSITGTKFGYFQPEIQFASTTATGLDNPTWDWYNAANLGSGYFYNYGHGWPSDTRYVEEWNIIASSSPLTPSIFQKPAFAFHVACPTCPTLPYAALATGSVVANTNAVGAYPNPASSELNITYSSANNANVSVVLTNMLGQVVANQSLVNGKAVINTSVLTDGLYIYSIVGSSEQITGRVVVAH